MHDKNVYNIDNWGEGYFTVNSRGYIEICKTVGERGVELESIVQAACRAGLHLPLLLRFTDILYERVITLYGAFANAITDTGYTGNYQLVYPIKVNQEYCVVRELLKAPGHTIGLEAGSKPELMAVMGLLEHKQGTIVCNGYKDSDYIRATLIAQQMGHKVFIIIEKPSELEIILRESERLQVTPQLGVRVRLVTTGAGKWENTSGPKSKFGLNADQILELISKLKQHGFLECLQLIHCNLGSQIANIHDIRDCMKEVARYYVELRHLEAPINTIDIGGGLAVDYNGTHSNTDCSMNYSLKEYAMHVLLAIQYVCNEANMPEPNVISESGRALTAHHAVLVTNITDIDKIDMAPQLPQLDSNDSHVVRDILDTYQAIPVSEPTEIYHYAAQALKEAHSLFKHGVITLSEKVKVEQLYTTICMEIRQYLDPSNPGDAELLEIINVRLAAKIFCNVSFFQSLPDAWAIGQIFPVAPISQLDKPLCMHSILQDLTCDSDGTLKQYTGSDYISSTLLLPPYEPKNPYNLAFFLVGAYQEILGNLHNLFGDTNSMDVTLTADGKFEINDLVSGDTVSHVLHLAHYDTKQLLQSYKKQLIRTKLSNEQIQAYLDELRSVFAHLTYLGH